MMSRFFSGVEVFVGHKWLSP